MTGLAEPRWAHLLPVTSPQRALMMEMAKARYTIHIPNHVRHVGIATQQYLTGGPFKGVDSAVLSYGHPHDSLHVLGEETPELDSHMKQTGTFVGELANVPTVDVVKQGKNLHFWRMRNHAYQPQPVAAPAALAGPQYAPMPSVGPQPQPAPSQPF